MLPAAEPPASDNLTRVKQIIDRADEFNAKYPDFVCRLTRTERMSGSSRSPEVMMLKFRLKPRSVYLKWLDPANEGRECIYVEGKNNGKMVSRGGRGDLLLAGKQLWLDPNGSLARSKSSQPITETGLDIIVKRIMARWERLQQGDNSVGMLTTERAPDPNHPETTYDWIVHECPPGKENDLPKGGKHRWGFRLDNGRLEIVEGYDPRGQPAYVFRFERYIPVTTLTDNDYDPEKVFPLKQASREGADQVAEAEKEVAK